MACRLLLWQSGSATEVNVGVGRARSEIKVENRRDHEWSAEDFSEESRKSPSLATSSLASPRTCLSATSTFARTSTSSLSTSKQEDGRRAEGLEGALRNDACLCEALEREREKILL